MRLIKNKTEFTLTGQHIKLLQLSTIDWVNENAVGIKFDTPDPAYLTMDICAKLEWTEDMFEDEISMYDAAMDLHMELKTALEVIMSARSFEPGVYTRSDQTKKGWKLKCQK